MNRRPNRPHHRGNRPQRRPFKQGENPQHPEESARDGFPADGQPSLEAAPAMVSEAPQAAEGGSTQSEPQQQPSGDEGGGGGGEPRRFDRDRRRHRHGRDRRNRGGGGQNRQQEGGRQREENAAPSDQPLTQLVGILDVKKDNTAFLRRVTKEGEQTGDVFLGGSLRPGDYRPGVVVTVDAIPAGGGKAPWTARKIVAVDGEPPENAKNVAPFERGTVIDPYEWLRLETGKEPLGTRFIDLFCPIGKGTRGMIVAPPRSGKTILLKQIAQALVTNHPEVKLIIVLVDERPEEVTDFKRSVPQAEVWASSNDESIQSHLDMARLVINRSKRLVEKGGHVVMLLDSITRLARAFNAAGEGAKGRTMSGGMAAGAMQEPRAIFGASRCFEDAGSLTIIATALVETGSAMDELIFQEFKGTGNMELVLDRKLAEKRLFPAIDISASGTRKDEKLQDPQTHKMVGITRRYLSGMDMVTGMTRVLEVMNKTNNNAELLKKFEP